MDRYVLLGWPLAFSLSPAIQRAAFAAAGLAADYDLAPTKPAELATAMARLKSGAWAGGNITVPHKVAVRSLLDQETDAARAVGAVNTLVRRRGGCLIGDNTDVVGFEAALAAADPAPGGPAVILGAGGAARAAVWVLQGAGHPVTVMARRQEQAAALLADLVPHQGPLADFEGRGAALLVNATPVGSVHCPGDPWPADRPLPAAVVDMVAWPLDTPLLRRARAAGATTVGGLTMLLAQAAASFSAWTGLPAPGREMAAAAIEAAQSHGLAGEAFG